MENRKCLECYEQLRGRADQKFCSDQCRSAYNNKQYIESHNVINSVNRILKKNYFILSALLSEGKVTTSKSDLQKKGYRFDYFTCTSKTKSNRIYYYCYDQGYRENENNKVTLVKQTQKANISEMSH
ncbi:MAG: hypothetical protein WCJ95_10810 [Mariniphaga sp.]